MYSNFGKILFFGASSNLNFFALMPLLSAKLLQLPKTSLLLADAVCQSTWANKGTPCSVFAAIVI